MRKMDENGLLCARYQARIFELSAKRFSCSSAIFLRRFVNSDYCRDVLDKNDSMLFSFFVEECYQSMESQYGLSYYGKKKFDPEVLYWMGYVTRCLCYMLDIGTKAANGIFPFVELAGKYEAYHTQSNEWVVRALMEEKGIDESFFDQKKRFKEAYLRLKEEEKREKSERG